MRFLSVLKNVTIVLSHIIKEHILKFKWYSWKCEPYNLTSVAVVDGRFYSGGLTDRFKGIVSLYVWAKSRNIPFRIEYTYPFPLTDYLIPNKLDWTIKDGDYVKAVNAADIIYSVGEPTVISRMKYKGINRQVHFYGNRDLLDSLNVDSEEWGNIFKLLFKPAPRLQSNINTVKSNIGNNYFSIVFRFQNLLGDFPEYDFKPLATHKDKEELIKTCLDIVSEIIKKEDGKTCLVTSDSGTFLREVNLLNGVKVIPGKLVHLGSEDNANYEQYEKSFIDFFLLSESTKVYSIVCGDMYPSDFPVYAAKVNNIPFERIRI